jgi:hypothetical protein
VLPVVHFAAQPIQQFGLVDQELDLGSQTALSFYGDTG